MLGKSPYFIAELACIHEGDPQYILDLARAVRAVGADAVKFQAFSPTEVVTPDHDDFAYLTRIALTRSTWLDVIAACRDAGLDVWIDVSGPFSLDLVERSGAAVAGVKIPSADTTNPLVLRRARELNTAIALSCAATPLVDLFEACDLLEDAGPVVLLHGYQAFPKLAGAPGGPPQTPIAIADLELWRLSQLRSTFPAARIGLADHLAGDSEAAIVVPAFAATLGATVIEKHVTLRRAERREDYFSALEPAEFARMVELVNLGLASAGTPARAFSERERAYAHEMKRTTVSARGLSAGDELSLADVTQGRDGSYRSSLRATRVAGGVVSQPVPAGGVLTDRAIRQRIGVFCNARLASSRLPRKALLPFYAEYTTLGYLLKRLQSYPGDIGQVVLATTTQPEDDALEAIAASVGVPCFRGDSEDVMGRMVGCADAFGWDVLVRVTGDDQLVSGEYIERALRHHLDHSLDYTRMDGLPIGMGSEIIDVRTLRQIHRAVVNRRQTEHLTWYLDSDLICRNGVIQADAADRHPGLRVTLDYEQDYELMRAVTQRAHERVPSFYVPTATLIETLLELDPAWQHESTLWPLTRAQVNTDLVYR